MINLSDYSSVEIILAWLSIFSISLLIVTIIMLRRSTKLLKNLKVKGGKGGDDDEARTQKDYQRIIEAANHKARNIILEANQINRDTLDNFQTSYDEILANQKEVLEDTSKTLTIKYKDQIDTVNRDNIELLTKIYKDIETYANTSFSDYKSVVEKQTFEAESIAKEKIKSKYAELDLELQKEKEAKLQKLNDDIYKILSNISKLIIGKSIDTGQHEDLIIEALNNAKKEGLD